MPRARTGARRTALRAADRDRAEHPGAVPERHRPGSGRRADSRRQGRPVAVLEVAVVGAERGLARQPVDRHPDRRRRARAVRDVTVVGRRHRVDAAGLTRCGPERLAGTDRHGGHDLGAVLERHRARRVGRRHGGREDRLAAVGVGRRARGELGRRRSPDRHDLRPRTIGVQVVDEQQAQRLVRRVCRVVTTQVEHLTGKVGVDQRAVVRPYGGQRGRSHAERHRGGLGADRVDQTGLGGVGLDPVLDLRGGTGDETSRPAARPPRPGGPVSRC